MSESAKTHVDYSVAFLLNFVLYLIRLIIFTLVNVY